jgi:hypothetical protein
MAATTMAAGLGQMSGATRGRMGSTAERNRGLYELQRKARRGPTPEVFFSKHIDNSRIVKADDPERRREMRTFTAVMGILFLLVMVYVWQHFSAIEVGYHVETQKQQVELLELGLDAPLPGQVVRPEGDGGASGGSVLAQATVPAPAPMMQ